MPLLRARLVNTKTMLVNPSVKNVGLLTRLKATTATVVIPIERELYVLQDATVPWERSIKMNILAQLERSTRQLENWQPPIVHHAQQVTTANLKVKLRQQTKFCQDIMVMAKPDIQNLIHTFAHRPHTAQKLLLMLNHAMTAIGLPVKEHLLRTIVSHVKEANGANLAKCLQTQAFNFGRKTINPSR